eukprot:gene26771-biopygen17325
MPIPRESGSAASIPARF